MKIRNGFVSNSSSSSFIILKCNLNDKQKEMLLNHIEIAKKIDNELLLKKLNYKYKYYEEWFIDEDNLVYWCHTDMDNFNLIDFIKDEIKIELDNIIYMGDYWDDEESLFDSDEYLKFKNKIRLNKIKKIKND